MDAKLRECAALGQKDKTPAFIALIPQALSQSDPLPDLHALVSFVVNEESVGLVVGRQVLAEVVKALGEKTLSDHELRKKLVQDTLDLIEPRIASYVEQANALRFQLADLLEEEEEWSEAARTLIGVNLDAGQRSSTDADKLRVYVRIVRLLLEDEDSVQAETFYNRAALLVHSAGNDKETLLQFKLCQARISDYSRKFLEAASRYHELSYTAEIDEDERKFMLSAAVTCAVLAPAGPNRSRILASLYRDERSAELPTFNVLSKMFLDHILRPAEIHEFEKTLKPHQVAKIAISSNDRLSAVADEDEEAGSADEPVSTRRGPSTVLDRAVMEHNLLASSKIYNNITFRGLGALLDLTPGAAETMARRMIEQGRLRGWIDQVDRLIWFEAREDEEAQGKAGGLGDVEEAEDTGSPFTKRWDMQIRTTAAHVESIVQHLYEKNLIHVATAA
ncbi:uncharacterized protein SCHCODRAFT_02622122 [Schizophyllum commune H4-8]|uniref:COP9 signalosome complex subunit 4 n=1 Tax=Schizophyllum commune (strain H4-8 / FGSC 9210) TaxID=578458 RepID=D8PQ30_SCHCM|nr:uncharacterized protein SCHCODRAFT_02622122 [Schizophyllum commune H4-8]KAI5893549.1 hypothetical protein SCHCODRAFT_02622122 [Schizophyllum commune H4-8]